MIDSRNDNSKPQSEANALGTSAPAVYSGYGSSYTSDDSSSKPLTEYPLLVLKHWPIVLVMLIIGVGAAMYQTSRTPRLYRSSAMLNIGTYVPPLEGPISASLREQTSKQNYQNTQIRLLKSITLANKVLEENEEILRFLDRTTYDNRQGIEKKPEIPVQTLQRYLGLVTFQSIPRTDLVMIYATTTSSVMSAEIANAHSDAFISLVKERRQSAANVNMNFLRERYEDISAKVEEAENRLLKHAKKHALGITSNELVETTFANKYKGLVSNLNQAIAQKAQLEAEYRELRRSKGVSAIGTAGSLEGEVIGLAKMQSRYDQLRRRLSDRNSPVLKDLEYDIKASRDALRQAGKFRVQEARNQYQAAADRVRFLRNEFEDLHEEQIQISNHKVEKDKLLQDVTSLKEVQSSLAKRLEDAMINAQSTQDTVTLVDKAFASAHHISPNERSNMWTGGLLGALLGVVLIFLLDYVDNRVRSVKDLQTSTRTPVLGVVPGFSKEILKLSKPVGRRRSEYGMDGEYHTRIVESDEVFDKPTSQVASGQAPTVVLDKNSPILPVSAPFSAESESFRAILATLTSAGDYSPRKILVTSGQQGDGKTTLAVNLAASLAQMSEKTLLIDADLRLPNVCKYFGLSKKLKGISDYLCGEIELDEAIINGGLPDLSLLLAGSPRSNPASLVRSEKMAELLDSLMEHYDYVIVDSPPIGPVADSLLLAQHVDGVAVVIRSGETSKTVAESAVARLRQVGANVLGLVLNDTQRNQQYWKRGYKYYNMARQKYI